MTAISLILKTNESPVVRHRMPKEPHAVKKASASIFNRWPNEESNLSDKNAEQLLQDVEDRRQSSNWNDYYWADIDLATRALIDNKLWRDERYSDLLEFLLNQARSGVNPPFVRTLFRKFIETFDLDSMLTRNLASVLKQNWKVTCLPIEQLVSKFEIFDLHSSIPQDIATFMNKESNPYDALRGIGVEAPHGPGLIESAHIHFVKSLEHPIANGEPDAILTILSWLKPPTKNKPMEGELAAQAINALLEPWIKRTPNIQIKQNIELILLKAYGDPRIRTGGVWSFVSSDALNVMLSWLTRITVEMFFEIIDKTDYTHMWIDRKQLWKNCLATGKITQAWFALSDDGAKVAEKNNHKYSHIELKFGRNHSKIASDRKKCLLIMKVAECWVVEGSHNFPTWLFSRNSTDKIAPYQESYTCEKIREAHENNTQEVKRIPHFANWRTKVEKELKA